MVKEISKTTKNTWLSCYALLAMLLSLSTPVFAAHEKGSSRLDLKNYNSSTNNKLFLQDDKYSLIQSNLATQSNIGFFDHSYKNQLVLGIDHTIKSLGTIAGSLSNNIYTAEVDVQVQYYPINCSNGVFTTGTNIMDSRTLKVNFSGMGAHLNASAPATETDLDLITFNNGYQSLATISAIRIYDKNGTLLVTTDVPENLYLELKSDAERYYTMGQTAFSANSAVQIQYLSGASSGSEIELKWLRVAGAEEYELEWLWLDEFTYGNSMAPANGSWNSYPELNFRNNSTRIRTDQNTYKISNIYQSGHLFFRIRAVGRCYTPASLMTVFNANLGGSMSTDVLCDFFTGWTWPDVQNISSSAPSGSGTPPVGGGITGLASLPYFIDLRGLAHEDDKNWVYTGTYAEDGKKKEVISYFDGSQRSRQTVTRNNSDNIAVVSETYYDFMGRPAIQAMPTPVQDATIKFYQQTVSGKTGFNFHGAVPYTKNLFAASSNCADNAPDFDDTYGTGKYYSANNNFQSLNYNNGYIASSEKYPYTQTEYTPDNTGRIARQSGVGKTMQIENNPASAKHDTRYLYGSVSQQELDRLFGSEAGYASHYSKKVVVDPNGQVTVSYLNQEGKVIATALSGGAPGNLDPLLKSDGADLSVTSNNITADLLNKYASTDTDTPLDKNELVGDELIFNDKIIVTTPQNYKFDYTLTNSSCYAGCSSFCYDCVYDLEFDIIDKCGNRPAGFTPVTYALGTIVAGTPPTGNVVTDATGNNNPVNFSFAQITSSPPLQVALDLGEYTISKKLKVNQQALEWYLKDYLAHCANTPTSFDVAEAVNLDISGCELDCKECADKLGSLAAFITNYQTASPNSTTQQATDQYNLNLKECYEPCAYNSYCEVALESMLSDVSPSGQYAEFSGMGSSFDASAYPLSVFNVNNVLPRRSNAVIVNWRTPLHYLTNTAGYVDELGAPDKVIVTEVSTGVYNPPVVMGGAVTAVSGSPGQFLVSPENLANASDFVTNFKPSWAKSLVTYHPEYCYIEWCLKNSTTLGTAFSVATKDVGSTGNYTGTYVSKSIVTSNDFDSLFTAIDDIDDIEDAVTGSYSKIFDPLTYDPYWTTTGYYWVAGTANNPLSSPVMVTLPNPAQNIATSGNVQQLQSTTSALPADFSANSIMYPYQKTNKTANNRFLDYKGTGLTLFEYAAFMATPLAQQYGQTMANLMALLKTPTYYPTLTQSQINLMSPASKDWILLIKKPGSASTDDSYKRSAWETYRTGYLAMKQELQQEAAQSYVMNGGCRGCNDCIGKPDFDENSIKYTTYSSQALAEMLNYYSSSFTTAFPANIFGILNLSLGMLDVDPKDWYKYPSPVAYANNKDQACGLATKELYKTKTKRYYKADDALDVLGSGTANGQASMYAQTGLCPNAYDLQGFLNAMVAQGFMFDATSYNLNANIPAFTQALYQAISPVIPTPFVNAIYNYTSINNSNRTLNASIAIGTPNCPFYLTLPASIANPLPSGINNWNNFKWQGSTPPTYTINQFGGLQPTSVSAYNIKATISGPGSSTGAPPITYTLMVSGSACFNLTECSFVPPCAVNGTGKALNSLLNAFASNGNFPAPYTTSYQIGNLLATAPAVTPYSYAFNNGIRPLLEGNIVTNTWVWDYNSSTKNIKIHDGGYGNAELNIAFTMPFIFTPAPGVSASPAPDISCIQSLQNFVPDPDVPGGFIADGIISNINNTSACPSGTLRVQGVASTPGGLFGTIPLNIGNCSFDLATCNTPEHNAKRDFQNWVINPSFRNTVTSTVPVNISSNQLFTSVLRGFLNSPIQTTSNGPQQNLYYWLPDAANTNNNQVKGWLSVLLPSATPGIPPSGSCNLVIKKITPGGTSVSSLLTGNMNVPIVMSNATIINNNFYGFKLLPTGGSANDTLLIMTSCFPLKVCATCVGGGNGLNSITRVYPIQPFDCTVPYTLDFVDGNTNITTPYTILPCGVYPPFNILEPMQALEATDAMGMSVHTIDDGGTPASQCILYTNNDDYSSTARTGSEKSLRFISLQPDLNYGSNYCYYNDKTIYQQDFSPPFTGVFGLSFKYRGRTVDWSTLTTDVCKLEAFVDNVNILSYNNAEITNPFTTSVMNNYFGSLTPLNFVYGQTYHLRIEITEQNFHHASNAIGYLQLINGTGTKLPCANTPWPTDTMPTAEYEEPCAQYLQDIVDNTADEKYDVYMEDQKTAFIRNYKQHCMGSAVENLAMTYNNSDYHYTLYYYDQAGNLTRTVPPEGVKPVDLSAIYGGSQTNGDAIKQDRLNASVGGYTKKVYTQHNFLTTYKYNSLNQLVTQTTPDAGLSKFYYDNLGRLVASQNAKQAALSSGRVYSFTRYDALGRINMVGQMIPMNVLESTSGITSSFTLRDVLSAATYPFNLLGPGSQPTEVTQTYYGEDPNSTAIAALGSFRGGKQPYSRGRVTSVTIEQTYDGDNNTYNYGTHYNYDIHGNVNELIQENRALSAYFAIFWPHALKNIEYTYDLISGKVNSVVFQRDQVDMMMHNYEYDANNRLTNVYTSRNGWIWDQDAKYYYYPHGPLARTELGDNKVQGCDYAYTTQGWLKGVNSEALVPQNDMGKDGYNVMSAAAGSYDLNRYNSRDAYGYALNYYSDPVASASDYLPINNSHSSTSDYFLAKLGNSSALPALYNGNISHMSASYLSPDPTPITLTSVAGTVNKYDPYCFMKQYKYDQLNRIKSSYAFAKNIDAGNNWLYSGSANEFSEAFKYDQNGNILSAKRNLVGGQVDDLTYYYYDANGTAFNPATLPNVTPTNRLAYVTDAAGTSVGDLGNQSANNYTYDKIGNLISDQSEQIQSIEWTVYGKIKKITPTVSTKPTIEFAYDAMGNRVSKKVTTSTNITTTYYTRDAQGNVMAVYTENTIGAKRYMYLSELHLYGSSRLGVLASNDLVGYINGIAQMFYPDMIGGLISNRISGQKTYELSNHLGNVMAVISDRKLPVDNNADNIADFYVPDMLSATDYYAFGAPIPGRQFNNGNYRFGLNGQENDNEISGNGNSTTADYWQYNPRLGRRWNVDPEPMATESSYASFNNSPIWKSDPNGDTTYIFSANGTYKGVIFDKLKSNEIIIMNDMNYKAVMTVKNKGKYSDEIVATVARDPKFADARITSNTAKQLMENWTGSPQENSGLLYADKKTKEVQVSVCETCKTDPNDITAAGQANPSNLGDKESELSEAGEIIGFWHSHPPAGTFEAAGPSEPDYSGGGYVKALQRGGFGVIVQKKTFSIYPLMNSSTRKIPQIDESPSNALIHTPKFAPGYPKDGIRSNRQHPAFDKNISPKTRWTN